MQFTVKHNTKLELVMKLQMELQRDVGCRFGPFRSDGLFGRHIGPYVCRDKYAIGNKGKHSSLCESVDSY